MKVLVVTLLLAIAGAAGLLTGELLFCSSWTGDVIGNWVALRNATPDEKGEVRTAEALRRMAAAEVVHAEAIERELKLLRAQFADEATFTRALETAALSVEQLLERIAEHRRGHAWITSNLGATAVTPEERRQHYERNRDQFAQPGRFRASHIFLAAPVGSAPEVTAAKSSLATGLSVRILAGENLAELAAEASEDVTTKSRGGDLGYFSGGRIAPEFLTELKKLRVGEISPPIRSHLGFHIVQLTDMKQAREMSFEEAQAEIALALANERRAATVGQFKGQAKAAHFGPD